MGGITDIEEPLTAWAKHHLGVKDEKIKSGDVILEIDTSKLRIKTSGVKFASQLLSGNGSPSGVVFKSKYVNKTDAPQEHTFIMERTTEATVTTSLTKSFTRNGTVGININVPEAVSNATGGFGSEVTVETEDENTVKHSLSWSINSKVHAAPKKTTVAELRITEQRSHFGFTADVILKGRILAKVTDASTGKTKQTMGDLATILHDQEHNGGFIPNKDDVFIDIYKRNVTWKVEGSLNFRFGASQDVEVGYEPSSPDKQQTKK